MTDRRELAAEISAVTQDHAAAGCFDLAAIGLQALVAVADAARCDAKAEILRVRVEALTRHGIVF